MKIHQRAANPAPEWASRAVPGRIQTVCGHAIQTGSWAGGIPQTHIAESVADITCVNCLSTMWGRRSDGALDNPTGDDADPCAVCGERRDMHVWRTMPGTVFIDGVGETRCEEWGDAERS